MAETKQYENPYETQRVKGRPYRIAIVLAIIVFMLLAPEIQEGKSMDPTISDGQAFVVTKTRYSAKKKTPEQGRLVILEKTLSLEAGAEDNIITRVIAVPGDSIEIKNGKVLVNGEEYETPEGITGARKNYKKTVLKGNQVFVLNDNRNIKSIDSLDPALGLVDMREIKGNVVIRVWPIKEFAGMDEK